MPGQTQSIGKEYLRIGGRLVATEGVGQTQGSTVRVDVWPGSGNLGPNQSLRLNSVVTGTTNGTVVWSKNSNLGSLSASGVYTAPPYPQQGDTVTITATSLADPTKSATSVVRFYGSGIGGTYPLMGSFLNFYRNLGQSQWNSEFERMKQIDMNTIVIVSVGALRPVLNSSDYTLSGVGLLYPSELIPVAERPTTDRLEMILSLADSWGMKVYVGSLQTYGDWSTGVERPYLRQWNNSVMSEIVARYGNHPSLEGWYYTQELWMNWVRFHIPADYYGTKMLKEFVDDMRLVDPTKPVAAAVVVKKTIGNPQADLTPEQLQTVTQSFIQTSGLQILMPQDGGGAEAGAPSIAEIPQYFQAMKNAVEAAGIGTALWSTVETFTQIPGYSNDRYPPASAARIQQQVNNVRPYVTGMVNWIYGNDMSDQATYYPIEASAMDREYRWRFRPTVSPQWEAHNISSYTYTVAPTGPYLDSGGELSNRAGGGFNGYNFSDWVGHTVESSNGVVRVVADLGTVKAIRNVKALSLSMLNSGIYHPSSMTIEISNDGISYTQLGSAATAWQNTTDFSVGWTEVPLTQSARYVRCSFAHVSWMFLAELEILGPPTAPPPPPASIGIAVDPSSVGLTQGQTQQFTASVSGTGNTAVTWSVSPTNESLSSQGLYTVPAVITTARSVTITATSVADTSKTASALVTLNPTAPTGMTGPVNPSSGVGSVQIFHVEATAISGSVSEMMLLINSTISATNACFVQFNPGTNTIALSADNSQSASWTWAGYGQVGEPGIISNSQCEIDLGNSSSTITGGNAALNVSLRFKPAFAGFREMNMTASDTFGNMDGWLYKGYWVVQ